MLLITLLGCKLKRKVLALFSFEKNCHNCLHLGNDCAVVGLRLREENNEGSQFLESGSLNILKYWILKYCEMVWLRCFFKTVYHNDTEAFLRKKKNDYVSRMRMKTKLRGKNKEARQAQSVILILCKDLWKQWLLMSVPSKNVKGNRSTCILCGSAGKPVTLASMWLNLKNRLVKFRSFRSNRMEKCTSRISVIVLVRVLFSGVRLKCNFFCDCLKLTWKTWAVLRTVEPDSGYCVQHFLFWFGPSDLPYYLSFLVAAQKSLTSCSSIKTSC